MMRGAGNTVALALGLAVVVIVWGVLGNPLAGAPLALGVVVLFLQSQAAAQARASHLERDEVLPLLQAALPKLRAGMPIDAAFIAAAATLDSATGARVGLYCARARQGLDLEAKALPEDTGPIARTVLRMISSARANGGDLARPFASLATMIETDQKLRRRQEIATLHVRTQANALGFIVAIILTLVAVGNGDSLSYLRDTRDGRLMLLFALTSIVWGYAVLAALAARISNV